MNPKDIQHKIKQLIDNGEIVASIPEVSENISSELKKLSLAVEDVSRRINSAPSPVPLKEAEVIARVTSLVQSLNSKKSKKRILVAGFFGAFNLGDELMLETLLVYLEKHQPSADITIMLSDNYACDITRYGDYHLIHYPATPLEINVIAKGFDALIFPGGAIIDDINYCLDRNPLTLGTILVTLSLRFITMNKPCILYGLSTSNSLSNADFLEKLKRISHASTHFSLRDDHSIMTLNSAGFNTNELAVVDDIAFANRSLLQAPLHDSHSIGLIYVYSAETLPAIVKFTKLLLESTPKTTSFKLIPFYDYNNNDVVFANQILAAINNPRVSLSHELLGDFQQTVSLIGSMKTIFSMRYHGTLISGAIGNRTICINYDTHPHYPNKNKYLQSHYGFVKHFINFSEIDRVDTDTIQKMLRSKTRPPDIKGIYKRAAKELGATLKGIL